MELHELDLNLLVVFNQLLIERRVSKVAETLGISENSVKTHLKRGMAALALALGLPDEGDEA